MFCEKCGSQLGEGASFCFNCGAQVNTQQNNQSYQNQQVESQYMQCYQNHQMDPQYMQGYQNQQMDPQYMQGYQNQQMDPQYMQGYQNQQMDPQYMQGYQEQRMDTQYAQNDQQQYSLPQNGQVPPVKESKQKKERKKINLSKKSKIIISVAAVAVIAVVVVVLMLPGNLLSPQRRIIDKYFDAINDKDIDAIDEITFTDEVIDTVGGTWTDSELLFFTSKNGWMGFSRGFYESDYVRTLDVVEDSYPSIRDGLSEKQVTKRTLDMLEVTYDVIDIQPLEDIDLYMSFVNGEEEKIDIEFIEDKAAPTKFIEGELIKPEVHIDDVYVARVDVEWKYDDMLYGIDKDWWEDDVFKEHANYNNLSTYNKAINAMNRFSPNSDEFEYILILYEVDGEWHILHGNRLSTLKSMTYDGKTVIYAY